MHTEHLLSSIFLPKPPALRRVWLSLCFCSRRNYSVLCYWQQYLVVHACLLSIALTRFNVVAGMAAFVGTKELVAFTIAFRIVYLVHQFGLSIGIGTSARVVELLSSGDVAGAKRCRYPHGSCQQQSRWIIACFLPSFLRVARRVNISSRGFDCTQLDGHGLVGNRRTGPIGHGVPDVKEPSPHFHH